MQLGPDGVYYFGFKKNLEKYYSCSDVVLGKGSYGTVVVGHNLKTKEPVAIKQIEKRQMVDDQERRDLQVLNSRSLPFSLSAYVGMLRD